MNQLTLLNCQAGQIVQEITRLDHNQVQNWEAEKIKLRVYQQLSQAVMGQRKT